MRESAAAIPPSRPINLLPISLVLVGGGLLMVLYALWSYYAGGDAAPPYEYALISEGGIKDYPDLDLKDAEGFRIQKYQLRVAGIDKPLVDFHVASKGTHTPPVLLDWDGHLQEPVLTVSRDIKELNSLVAAVRKHLPESASVLAWWDTARALELLAGVHSPFQENLAVPVIIPSMWSQRKELVEKLEDRFWGISPSPQSQSAFMDFVDALSMDEAAGVSKLATLAGKENGYLIINQTDAYRLGMIRPERFGIGYKDFPKSGELHGLITYVKSWLKKEGYESYLVTRFTDSTIRVYFLTDKASQNALIAKLLPFTTSNPMQLKSLHLVYQHGGYWVYKFGASDASDAAQEEKSSPDTQGPSS